MRRIFISISFITCILLCQIPLTALADNVSQEVLEASASVVYIEVESSPLISQGSGFVIKNDSDGTYIATNNHVIELNPKGISVWTGKDEKRAATVVTSSIQYDLAIIKIPEPIDAQALVLSSSAEQGDEVFAVGFPEAANYLSSSDAHLSNEVTITNGIISSIRTMKNVDYGPDIELLQINADINPGNSGGPLLDRSGHVIGINTYGVLESQGIFGAISASELISYAEENNINLENKTQSSFQGWIIYVLISIAVIAIALCMIVFIPKIKGKQVVKTRKEIKLSEYLSRLNRPIAANEAVSLLMPILLVLREKHNQGTLYLKLSPSSVIVKKDGCLLNESNEIASDEFFAPEQRSGGFSGIRTDIFGACALLRYMLEYYYKIHTDDEKSLDTSIDMLNVIINKGLSDLPEDRYSNIQELILELAPFNTGISEQALIPFIEAQIKQTRKDNKQDVFDNNFNGKPKNKKLKYILISGIGLIIVCTIGFFTINYFSAIQDAASYNFAEANTELGYIPFSTDIFQQDSIFISAGVAMENREYDKAISELRRIQNYNGAEELLLEVKYRKAAYLANQNSFDDAIYIYHEIKSYKDSATLIDDTTFRKACYLSDNGDYNQALAILQDLSTKNYPEADDKIAELYYEWGNALISQEKYLDAYDKLNLAGDYLDTKQIIVDLKDYIYYLAIDYYHSAQYVESQQCLESIGNYLDSNAYLTLIDAHLVFEPHFNLDAYINFKSEKLWQLIGFEDAAQLLVSDQGWAALFLLGTWRGDSRYFIMKADGSIRYDIPWINYGDYYRIEDGLVLLYKEESFDKTVPLYKITVVSESCIQIFSFKNSRTYTLYRQ